MSISLNAARNYAAFAGTALTNTGPSILSGNIGLSPGTAITGFFPSGTYSGTQNISNLDATTAKSDLQAAYNQCAALTPTNILSKATYATTNNQELTPGIYSVGSSLHIDGNLILNGDCKSVFIFKIGSTLETLPLSTISLTGGVQPSNIFWCVGSSATLGTSSSFNGYILANTSITANTSASIQGGLFAITGSVTLDTNLINNPVVCYIKGTKILTICGYKNIEDIKVGDEIVTFGNIRDKKVINKSNDKTTQKVIFNGYFSKSNLNVESKPIVFKIGSLGENLPFEDVMISPGHGIIINNKSILALDLINNVTIYQSEDYESITYYHLQLETHSVINAAGLLGESLLRCQEKLTPV